MRVLVTGSEGFIGKNLCMHLKEMEGIEVITFDINDSFSKVEDTIESIDFIFHLAGVNRPNNIEEFYKGNTELTASIVELLNTKQMNTPIIMTSSIQANRNNDYGKSKKEAEDVLLKYGSAYIYRLHNVFGKWCRPNYNSVVATFCHNIANNLEITVNDSEVELELIYIDDIVEEFMNVLKGNAPSTKESSYCYINPVYRVKLGDLASYIKSFGDVLQKIDIPEVGNEFIKKLFSTYLSYVRLDDIVLQPVMNIDERGNFTELLKTENSGQVSISVSKKGVVRGNHYHHTKVEKFIVVKGEARISFRHLLTNEVTEILVDDRELKIVTIPVGYTHKIENTGEEDMILLIWANEVFDNKKADTFYCNV